ncbi:tonB-system energizer ExbB [Marinimicrobium alkaliphilum]|uniref:tonB-system energizer ExbB n=1 Tax=Marinimicrobium alkaliphilum TaxID=2202654 RepID=UPI000DBA6B34|nr:tonB-system energizer ExbB [Marinimicrobium alkaliphilum]
MSTSLFAASAATSLAAGHDLSPWGMFMMADWVVKSVMIGLVFASVLTWTIWLVKTLELARARRDCREPLARLQRAGSLHEAVRLNTGSTGPIKQLLWVTDLERKQSRQLPTEGIKERLTGRFARIEASEARRAKAHTGILASVGSTAPFIGLFGTVWGIMNSFIGIADAQTTNLAVVAPGIAEALLATALGLVAAIPAVMMYNQFARKVSDYRAVISTMAGELLRLVSLDLDRQSVFGDSHQDEEAA